MTCGPGILPTHTGIILQSSGIPGSLPLQSAGAILGTTAAGIGDLTTIHGTMILGTTAAGIGTLGTITTGDGDTHPGIGILGITADGTAVILTITDTMVMDGTVAIILTIGADHGVTGPIGCPGHRQSADAAVTEWVPFPPMSGV